MSSFSLLELVSGMEDSVHSAKLLTQDTGFDTSLFTIAELTVKDLQREVDDYLGFLSIYEKLDSSDVGHMPESLSYARGKVEAFFQCNGIEIDLDGYSSEAVKDTVRKVVDNLKKVIASLVKKVSEVFAAIKKSFLNFMGWGKENAKKNKEKVKQAKDVEKAATSEQRKDVDKNRKDAAKAASRVNKEKIKEEMDKMENSTSDLLLIVPEFISESGEFNLSNALATKEQLKKLSELPLADIAAAALKTAKDGGKTVPDIITEFFEAKLGKPNSKNGYKLTYDFNFGSIKIDANDKTCRFLESPMKSVISNMSTDDCDTLIAITAELSQGIAKNITDNLNKAQGEVDAILNEGLKVGMGEPTDETRVLVNRYLKAAKEVSAFMTSYARNVARAIAFVDNAQSLVVADSLLIELKQLEKSMNKN